LSAEVKNPIRSSGWVSKFRPPSGNAIHGCLLRVQKCTVGCNQEVSSRVPARTLRTAETWLSGLPVQIHEPHAGHNQRICARPLSGVRCTAFGSPVTRRKVSAASTSAIENALLDILWQSVQWQV